MSDKIIKQLHYKLLKKEKTIAVAESCTGGLLSSLLTSLPGSSNYFILGVVTYSNKAKEMILKIPAKTITKYGAVSRQIAISMAKNIRKKTKADFGLSITGIAGPAGATATKPVGTIFIAITSKNKTLCRLFLLPGKREIIRKRSAQKALRLLYTQI
jgi:nicotinamide-nucleotide amidase